jgi:YfiH family protein
LLADKQKPIIGAIHAGWRGTFDGVIQNTVALMWEKGATDIIAAIGPCIHHESYEVGPEFHGHFENHPTLSKTAQFSDFFSKSPSRLGHFLFNLPKLVHNTLTEQGIVKIDQSSLNTFTNEDHFFSYRRKTLRNEPDMGCQASCIVYSNKV